MYGITWFLVKQNSCFLYNSGANAKRGRGRGRGTRGARGGAPAPRGGRGRGTRGGAPAPRGGAPRGGRGRGARGGGNVPPAVPVQQRRLPAEPVIPGNVGPYRKLSKMEFKHCKRQFEIENMVGLHF